MHHLAKDRILWKELREARKAKFRRGFKKAEKKKKSKKKFGLDVWIKNCLADTKTYKPTFFSCDVFGHTKK